MRVGAGLLSLIVVLCVGCSRDNATALADQVREGASRLNSSDSGPSATVSFEPVTGAPYTVVFFPNREMTEADVVAAGVNKEIADRIYKEMAYLGSMASELVVVQDSQVVDTWTVAARGANT